MNIQRILWTLVACSTALGLSASALPPASGGASHVTGGTPVIATRYRLPNPGEFNVLVIVLDDLGTDKLAMYGVDPGPPYLCASPQVDAIPTPKLDQLRADGVMFSRCYVNPTCSPTRAAFLTGRYGLRTGMGHAINASENPGYQLPLSEVCLPEMLRDLNTAGYKRGAFGKWHVTDDSTDDCHPADCGFEQFEGLKGNPPDHYAWRKVTSIGGSSSGCSTTSYQWYPLIPGDPPSDASWDADVTRRDATTWINSLSPTDPFFAYVAFSPPHEPNQVPPTRVVSARTRARLSFLGYDPGDMAPSGHEDQVRLIFHTMVEAVDTEIEALLDGISPTVLAKTMVIVIGDNGTPGDKISDPDLGGHGKRSLYELGTRVPLIVYGPLVGSHGGETCRNLVGGVDLWRTVGVITGERGAAMDALMGAVPVDSRDFTYLIQNPAAPALRTTAYFEAFHNGAPPPLNYGYLRGITDGSFRYMRICSDAGVVTERLFHTSDDPCEQTNLLLAPHVLTGAESAVLDALRAAMDGI
jgi:arylsulfatase B